MADAALGMFARFVEENARKAGVPVIYVNPAYTSRTCPDCGNRDKANRPCGSATFTCVACGHAARADKVAAINIARKGKVAWDALRAEAALAPAAAGIGIVATAGRAGVACGSEKAEADGSSISAQTPDSPESGRARRKTPRTPQPHVEQAVIPPETSHDGSGSSRL